MAQVHALTGAEAPRSQPIIRKIGMSDLKDALAAGLSDFSAMPTHAIFLCLIYPIIGLILARGILGYDILPLLFPLAAGFALVGPFAALGFYELSRRREQGLECSWENAFDVLHSPSRGAIAALALLLLIIFCTWIAVAQSIYVATFGYQPAASIPYFLREVFHHTCGLDAHHRRQRRGFSFCGSRLEHQRNLVSAAARSGCGSRRCGTHFSAGGWRQPNHHGGVGVGRRSAVGDRLVALLLWSRRGGAGARSCDLALVSQSRGRPP